MMTRLAAAAMLLAPGFAAAQETELTSRIDRVTVYPDGAVVTRMARADLLQGASRLVLRGLPASIDPASIRVEGKGDGAFAIGAVDVRLAPGEARPVLDAVIEGKLKGLREEKATLEGRVAASEGKRATIERFGQAGPGQLGPDGKALPLADWPAVFDAIGTALVQVHDELRFLKSRIADVTTEIATLERAQPNDIRISAPKHDVTIALEAQGPAKAELAVSYRVRGAAWKPVYEARLTTGEAGAKPQLLFSRRAELRQRTGESWADVAVTLSTTRTVGGTRAPELPPLQVMFVEPPSSQENRAKTSAAPAVPRSPGDLGFTATMSLEDRLTRAEPARPAETQTASLDAGAYQASFRVPGRVTVPQDHSPRLLVLSQAKVAPALAARIAPELAERAYLEVSFTHEEEAPLLPGEVILHRDGGYIGKGRVELVAPGDKVALGFGADDKLKVTRAPVRRRENEPGWLGQTRTDLREFRTIVKSLHAQPVTVTLSERVPFSESSAITVETLPPTTPPTEKQVADKRGVMAWSFDLPAGAEKEIRLAYRIKWPGDRELSYQPAPVR